MNDPRPQFSRTYDHKFENHLGQNHPTSSQINSNQEFLQFNPNSIHQDSDDSGVCSPPLWKTTPSPPRSPSRPLLGSHRNLSPDSRLRAITRGQRELMEMVKIMPESSYELSLKDLVEHHRVEIQNPQLDNQNLQNPQLDNQKNLPQRGGVKVKRQESKKNDKNLMRVESLENKGLFLNMVFPFSVKSKKKKSTVKGSSGRVSPKPEVVKVEKDWWKKKLTGSSDSDSSRMSSGRRKKEGLLRGCWPFLQWRSSKSVE